MGAAASTSYRLGQETSGSPTIGAGIGGVASAASAAARQKIGSAGGISAAAEAGQRAALLAGATSSAAPKAAAATASDVRAAPDWARRLRSEQAARHHRHAALQAIRDGDRPGAPANPDISEKE